MCVPRPRWFIARNSWLYVSILGAGYFISRGLAKAGSYEPDADYNPVDLTDRDGAPTAIASAKFASAAPTPRNAMKGAPDGGGSLHPHLLRTLSYSQNAMNGTPMIVVLCVWVLTPNVIRPRPFGRFGVRTSVSRKT